MPANVEQWITLKDFSPGIRARVAPSAVNTARATALGVADSAGTYRCQALPDGSLGPLPKVSPFYTPPTPVGFSDVTGGRITVSGFLVVGAVDLGFEYHIAYEGNKISTNKRFWYWQRYREDKNLVDYPYAYDPCSAPGTRWRPTYFHQYRAAPTDPLQGGVPGVVAAWYAGGGGAERMWGMFPDPANPTILSVRMIGTGADPTIGIAHQGRSVIFDQGSYSHGPNGSVWTHDEDIYYTNTNLPTVASINPTTFGMENATGYAGVTSSSYSELILLKEREGGLFVQGDMADPTVRRLPGIPTIGNFRHMPAVTPLGVVFLAHRSGAWLWSGGEAAQHISDDAIDGSDFWISAGFVDFYGRIWPWYDWVVFPNNWIWNWKQQNWFRLEDPSIFQCFFAGPVDDDSGLRMAPASWGSGEQLIWNASHFTAASSYQWTSLPLPIAEDRQVQIREVVFVVAGNCNFTFELFNRDGTIETHNVTATSTTAPQYFRRNSNVKCQHLKLRITSSGGTEAGIVYEVRVGVQQDTHYPHGGP